MAACYIKNITVKMFTTVQVHELSFCLVLGAGK